MSRKPRPLLSLLTAVLALVLAWSLAGCKSEPKETAQPGIKQEAVPDDSPPAAATSMADEDWLLLVEYLPLGETYDDVKGRFTALGQDMPEGNLQGLGEHGLTEAKLSVNVLDRDELLEFNFKHDTLYSCYFTAAKLDTSAATGLWDYLHEFYAAHFGDSRDEEQHESDYYSETAVWDTDRFDVVLTLLLYNSGEARVVWGFQDPSANGR